MIDEPEDFLDDDSAEANDGWKWRAVQTAVTLLILFSFLGVILVTFYNQFTGRQTLPANLPKIAYLNWDESGTTQLFATEAFAPEALTQLTFEADNVTEFAVSPAGTAVAYVVQQEDGSTTINLLEWNGREANNHRHLLECTEAACERLVWHPDGRRLVYERRESTTPRLWWLDTKTGETITVLADDTAVSQAAAFSADGKWLSFADLLHEEIGLYELGQGSQTRLTNLLGSTAVWHPENEEFLFSDIDLITYHGDENESEHQEHSHDFAQSIHLYYGNLTGEAVALLSDTGNVDDANPAWSPGGNAIAFGRKPIGTTAGRQLWLMQADGTQAHALTTELNVHHGPPIWSPDGRYLLFQRFDISNPDSPPSLWLLEVVPNNLTEVSISGFLPAWLP